MCITRTCFDNEVAVIAIHTLRKKGSKGLRCMTSATFLLIFVSSLTITWFFYDLVLYVLYCIPLCNHSMNKKAPQNVAPSTSLFFFFPFGL
jgi:hypothetical protein